MGAWRNSTGDPTVGPRPKVWTRGQNGSSAKDGAPERLGCGTVKEVSQILQRVFCMKNSPSVLSCIGKRTIEGCDLFASHNVVKMGLPIRCIFQTSFCK